MNGVRNVIFSIFYDATTLKDEIPLPCRHFSSLNPLIDSFILTTLLKLNLLGAKK